MDLSVTCFYWDDFLINWFVTIKLFNKLLKFKIQQEYYLAIYATRKY